MHKYTIQYEIEKNFSKFVVISLLTQKHISSEGEMLEL